jgi:hypothetical protein
MDSVPNSVPDFVPIRQSESVLVRAESHGSTFSLEGGGLEFNDGCGPKPLDKEQAWFAFFFIATVINDNYFSQRVASPSNVTGFARPSHMSQRGSVCSNLRRQRMRFRRRRTMDVTGAEDRATVRTDLSAASGAKTEWGGTMPPSSIRDWHQSAKSIMRPRALDTRHTSCVCSACAK